MPLKRKNTSRKETMSRYIKIDEWDFSISVRVRKERGCCPTREPMNWLRFSGLLEEPVKGVTPVIGSIFPEADVSLRGSESDPCVGSIISIRKTVDVVLIVSFQEYSWLLTLASGGQLGACYLHFSQPMRGRALVYSFSFDKELPPIDDR